MLHIKLLGHAQFHFSDRPNTQIRSSLGCAVFGYLIRQPAPVARAELSQLFWPHLAPADAKTYLRNVLRRLKLHFHPWIQYDRKSVWVNLDGSCKVDLLELEKMLAVLETKKISTLSQNVVNNFNKGLLTYEPFLGNFRHYRSKLFLDWIEAEDQEIRGRVMKGYATIANYQLLHKRYDSGLAVGKRMMEVDVSDPQAWKILMQCHYVMGNFRQAQLAFEKYDKEYGCQNRDSSGVKEILELYREIGRMELDQY